MTVKTKAMPQPARAGAGATGGVISSLHLKHSIKPSPRQAFMPGSVAARKRARRLLTAHQVKPGVWSVAGGEAAHAVTLAGAPPVYGCDCNGWPGAVDGMCSHCLAVWLVIDGKPSPRWRGDVNQRRRDRERLVRRKAQGQGGRNGRKR